MGPNHAVASDHRSGVDTKHDHATLGRWEGEGRQEDDQGILGHDLGPSVAMPDLKRQTLSSTVSRQGVGLHSGQFVTVTLLPAAFGVGRRLAVGDVEVSLGVAQAYAGEGCTCVRTPLGDVQTVEHLLAALDALGVTDVTVRLSPPIGSDAMELPALDGSAAPWVAALDEAGRTVGPPLQPRRLPQLEVEAAGGVARTLHGPDELQVEIDFGPAGPAGTLTVPRSEAAFREHVAWARTFVRATDIERLRAAGRGRGANRDNTLVWPQDPRRSPDEPVRHKLLDAWGDLALLGPFLGTVQVQRGSHALHLALVRAIADAEPSERA